MNPSLATVVYVAGILALFYLDRDRRERTSITLWIPTVWLGINASRPVSQWLPAGPTIAQSQQYLEGSPLDAAVYGLLVAAAVIVLLWRSQKTRAFLGANTPMLVFLTYCAVSTLWSDYTLVAAKRWVKSAGDVAMVLVVLTDPDPVAAIKRLLSRTGFILLPLSVLFIKYYPNLGRSYNGWTWVLMYSGVTMFKNLLGMTSMVCGLGSVWCFATAYRNHGTPGRMRHLIAHGAVIGMAVWLFFKADSMTSLSTFTAGAFLIVMTGPNWVSRRAVLVHVLVAVIVGVSLFALFFDTGGSLVESLGRDRTLTGRTAIWDAVLSLVKNPWLGTGFESFWLGDRLEKVWQRTNEYGIQEAHNGYLEVYLNLGWVGVTLLAVLIITGYRSIISVFRRDRNVGRLLLAYFVVGVVYSLTEAGFRMMTPVWITFLLSVLSVSQFLPKQARKPEPVKSELLSEAEPVASAAPFSEEYV